MRHRTNPNPRSYSKPTPAPPRPFLHECRPTPPPIDLGPLWRVLWIEKGRLRCVDRPPHAVRILRSPEDVAIQYCEVESRLGKMVDVWAIAPDGAYFDRHFQRIERPTPVLHES